MLNKRNLYTRFGAAGVLFLGLVGCSQLINVKTDEQAWIEYQIETRAKRVPASATFIEQFSQVPVRKILLGCMKAQNPESCYRSEVQVGFDSIFKNHEQYRRLLKDFLTFYSFDRVQQDVDAFHRVLLSGMELRAHEHAKNLILSCQSTEEIGVNLTAFKPFLGGDTDVPKGFYRCLNDHFDLDQRQLLKETAERLGLSIQTEDARQWIQLKLIHPIYEQVGREWFRKQAQADRARWNNQKEEIRKKIDFQEPVSANVKRLSSELRSEFPYLGVEVALTALFEEGPSK